MPVDLNVWFRPGLLRIELIIHPKRFFKLLLLLLSTALCKATLVNSEIDFARLQEVKSSIRPFQWSSRRTLLQSTKHEETPEQTQTESLVALIVIISVALLFLLKICICMARVSWAEREAENAGDVQTLTQTRNRNGRLPPPLPVLFINPGGSVRVGTKLKKCSDDNASSGDENQLSSNQLYLFGEAEVIDESSHASSPSSTSNLMTQPLLQDHTK